MIDREDGFAIPTVIFTLMVVSLLGLTITIKVTSTMRADRRLEDIRQANRLALTGIERVVSIANKEIEGDGLQISDIPNEENIRGQKYKLNVTKDGSIYSIEATGIMNEGQQNEVQEKAEAKLIINQNIVGKKFVTLKEIVS